MNVITEGANWIMRTIPKEVLEYAFDVAYPRHIRGNRISLESFVRTEMVIHTIIHDYNIIGAVEEQYLLASLKSETLPLNEDNIVVPYTNNIIYYLPKELTQGRPIVSVSNTVHTPGMDLYTDNYRGNASSPNCNTNIESIGAGLMLNKALGSANINGPNYRVSQLGETSILVEGTLFPAINSTITVTLGTDLTLSNVKNVAILIFRKLATLAAKMYIYNTCAIPMDIGVVRQGVNAGKLTEIIDSYSDSAQMYEELFNAKWIKIARMSDTRWHREWNDIIANVY